MVDPLKPIYDSEKPWGKLMWLPIAVGVVAVVGTICIAYHALSSTSVRSAQPTLLKLAAAWAVGAPVWFFVEYYFFYKKAAAPGSWDLFKHGQQLAIAVWAGFAATLYAVGNSDLARKDAEPRVACTLEFAALPTPTSGPTPMVVHCK